MNARGGSAGRLVAEFLVIVIGVLVALGADQWVQGLEERRLESEYLERLRADARYDREEIEFVRAVSMAGLAAVDSVLVPGYLSRATDDQVFNDALLAAAARQIDLSRGTWDELVASGRIELLRDAEVRLALAEYDRFVGEIAGYWDYTDNDLWKFVIRRLPPEILDAWDSTCEQRRGESVERFSTSQSTTACDFGMPAGSADALRADLATDEAIGELRLQRQRYQGLIPVSAALLASVDELERVLNTAR